MMVADLRGRVLYRDSNMLVIDKPAGLAVHAGPQTTVHVEGLLGGLSDGAGPVPRLVHRLDRDTSGCLILARHDKAVRRLGRLFGAGAVAKVYWAVVAGVPSAEAGRVALALRKVNDRWGWRMVADPDGQSAVTEWRRKGVAADRAWLELRPGTGRTHQLRVHCATGLGLPIVGDPQYGRGGTEPMHLHAAAITIPYWSDRPPIVIVAPPPPHMTAALECCGWRADGGAQLRSDGPGGAAIPRS
jgi:tRNA pseudouridine32 synthase/23S rRNA pseudouridine746 synthase/23S rRNA pseudouridine1911/1915/1917 synthase